MWRKFNAKPMYICKLLPRVSHCAILATDALNTIVNVSCLTPSFGRHVWSYFSPSFVSQTYCDLPPTNLTTKPHLRKCDVRLFRWGIIHVVRWSKTIQYRDRTLLVAVPKIAHSSLCPWSAVFRAFKLAGVYQSNKSASEPAFTLTHTRFTTKLKRTLDLCGYDSSRLAIILSYKVTVNRLHMSVT